MIPAHDEEPVIATVVKSCLELDYPQSLFQVVVIADNCSDRTASLAGRAGARVVERFDDLKKSKGYAIDYLIETLQKSGEIDSTDALVIVDADSTVDPDLLRAFDRELQSGHDWLQAYYTVSNPDESWRTRLLTYSFSLFNGVMPLGKTRLGVSAGVHGQRHVLLRSRFETRPLAKSWACRGHGILVGRADRRREDRVPARCLGLRRDARERGTGRGGSAPPLGVRTQRDQQEVSSGRCSDRTGIVFGRRSSCSAS